MKRLLTFLACLAISSTGYCLYEVTESINQASTTCTNDSFQRLAGPGAEILNVVVSSASSSGVFGLYDSSASAAGVFISSVNMNVVQNPFFNIRVSSGITYNTSGNVNCVTINYRKR